VPRKPSQPWTRLKVLGEIFHPPAPLFFRKNITAKDLFW
jgi:hypothetical protein